MVNRKTAGLAFGCARSGGWERRRNGFIGAGGSVEEAGCGGSADFPEAPFEPRRSEPCPN